MPGPLVAVTPTAKADEFGRMRTTHGAACTPVKERGDHHAATGRVAYMNSNARKPSWLSGHGDAERGAFEGS